MKKIVITALALSATVAFAQDNAAISTTSTTTSTTTTTAPAVATPGATAMPADKNQADGQKFLAENKTKPGVVTLPDGLQYKIIDAGTGPKPSSTSTVTVDYEGSLIDGTVFDSSYKRGQPISFPVNGVIKGWQEALPLMNTGATWMLYIPAELAYGAAGAGDVIGPNSTLIFKVHLISVQ